MGGSDSLGKLEEGLLSLPILPLLSILPILLFSPFSPFSPFSQFLPKEKLFAAISTQIPR